MRSSENTHGPQPGPDQLREEVLRAGLDLFAAYGVRFSSVPLDDDLPHRSESFPPVLFLGVCGFGGGTFTGHVVFGASEEVLRRSNNTRSTSADWMGELANQLLGRIKNGLLRRGIHVHRVPPVVIRAAGAAPAVSDGTHPLALADGKSRVLIWIDTEPSTEGASADLEPAVDVLLEGEMVMF